MCNRALFETLAARGLEEPRNSQELLTKSVDLTKFVGPLPFSVKYLKKLRLGNLNGVNTLPPSQEQQIDLAN